MMGKKLSLLWAMRVLRQPARQMVMMHTTKGGCQHWITPDNIEVGADLAEQIKRHPQIRAGRDGLFPRMDQTWKWAPEG